MPTKPVKLRATAAALNKYIQREELPLRLAGPFGATAKEYVLFHTSTDQPVKRGMLSELRDYILSPGTVL